MAAALGSGTYTNPMRASENAKLITSQAISPNLNHRIRSLKRAGSPSNDTNNANTNNASLVSFGGGEAVAAPQ